MLRNHGGVSTRECACHNLTLADTTLVDSISYGESGQDLVFETKAMSHCGPSILPLPHQPSLLILSVKEVNLGSSRHISSLTTHCLYSQ